MKTLERFKTLSNPVKFILGVSTIFLIIVLAKLGYLFGLWLRG